jgi:hypothetical protein
LGKTSISAVKIMNLPVIVSLLSLILCVIFFIYCRSYLKRRTGQERILAEFRGEVNEILAEIDEKTDRDALLVEERIKRLRGILEDVDKRIALYVRELDRRGREDQAYAQLGAKRLRGLPAGEPSVSPALPPAEAPPEERFPAGKAEEPAEGPRFTRASREIPPRPRPLQEQAVELARAGLSSKLIASRLEVSESEVELAIALAGRKSPRPSP